MSTCNLLAQWSLWVAKLAAPLHRRLAWRLRIVVAGILLASQRRTITNWCRAAAVTTGIRSYYYRAGRVEFPPRPFVGHPQPGRQARPLWLDRLAPAGQAGCMSARPTCQACRLRRRSPLKPSSGWPVRLRCSPGSARSCPRLRTPPGPWSMGPMPSESSSARR